MSKNELRRSHKVENSKVSILTLVLGRLLGLCVGQCRVLCL